MILDIYGSVFKLSDIEIFRVLVSNGSGTRFSDITIYQGRYISWSQLAELTTCIGFLNFDGSGTMSDDTYLVTLKGLVLKSVPITV